MYDGSVGLVRGFTGFGLIAEWVRLIFEDAVGCIYEGSDDRGFFCVGCNLGEKEFKKSRFKK